MSDIEDIEDDKDEFLIDKEKDAIALEIVENPNKEKLSVKDKDINALVKVGYDRHLIDIIYKNVFPVNIDEALDYLYKNKDNKFAHAYIATDSNVCAICEQEKSEHSPLSFPFKDVEQQAEKLESAHLNYNSLEAMDLTCKICDGDIEFEEIRKIKLPCGHKFCVSCWDDYLREKITNGKVYKISCMEHKCTTVLEEKFVRSIIGSDEDLLKKYDKFLGNKKILESNKKIKFCPVPDCDGYAEKKALSKYVKCNFGHEFCFVCGQKPHGWKTCSGMIDKGFEEWKTHTLVKRCPYCRFWTEKSDGCNHMTCSQCNFQWCWVCEQECVAGHYLFGTCKGLQFSDVHSRKDASNLLCDNCGLYCCFTWIVMKIVFLFLYLTMMPYLYLVVLMLGPDDDYNYDRIHNPCILFFFYTSFLPFFICYEIITISYVAVLSIPALMIWPYYRFLRYIFYGKVFGRLFSV